MIFFFKSCARTHFLALTRITFLCASESKIEVESTSVLFGDQLAVASFQYSVPTGY